MAKDKFGEIKIDRGSPAPEDTPDVPLSHADGESGEHGTTHVTVVHDPPENHRSRRDTSFIPGIKFPVPSKKTVAWLLTIPLAVILYGVGSYFLVPATIKGIFIPKVSRDLDRPISVGRIALFAVQPRANCKWYQNRSHIW